MTVDIPIPLPDELLYSVFARAARRLCLPSSTFCKHAFGRNLVIHPLFGEDLKSISKHLEVISGWKLSEEELRQNHTLCPISSPFLSQNTYQKYRLLHDSTRDLRTALGQCLNADSQFQLRYCRVCRELDLESYGESYWHRIHQIPGLKSCVRHSTPLVESEVTVRYQPYIALDDVKDDDRAGLIVTNQHLQSALDKAAKWLFGERETYLNGEHFLWTYQNAHEFRNMENMNYPGFVKSQVEAVGVRGFSTLLQQLETMESIFKYGKNRRVPFQLFAALAYCSRAGDLKQFYTCMYEIDSRNS